MTIEDYLAIPYILHIWTVKRGDGQWVRHAEYPELPGCSAEALGTVEVIEKIEAFRGEYIKLRLSRGEKIPTPRRPLRQ